MSLRCFRALIALASFQFFIYLWASLRTRYVLPCLLENWNAVEAKLFKLNNAGLMAIDTKNKVVMQNALVSVWILASTIPATMSALMNPQHPDYWLEVGVNFTIWTYFGLTESLHEMVVILTLKELRNNFAQVSFRHSSVSQVFKVFSRICRSTKV